MFQIGVRYGYDKFFRPSQAIATILVRNSPRAPMVPARTTCSGPRMAPRAAIAMIPATSSSTIVASPRCQRTRARLQHTLATPDAAGPVRQAHHLGPARHGAFGPGGEERDPDPCPSSPIPSGRESCGAERHPYELSLDLNGIDHRRAKVKRRRASHSAQARSAGHRRRQQIDTMGCLFGGWLLAVHESFGPTIGQNEHDQVGPATPAPVCPPAPPEMCRAKPSVSSLRAAPRQRHPPCRQGHRASRTYQNLT